MDFTWHSVLIVIALLSGLYLYTLHPIRKDMTEAEFITAKNTQMLAYVLWAVAVGLFVYCIYSHTSSKAQMGGNMYSRGTMCGAKAQMCGYPSDDQL